MGLCITVLIIWASLVITYGEKFYPSLPDTDNEVRDDNSFADFL